MIILYRVKSILKTERSFRPTVLSTRVEKHSRIERNANIALLRIIIDHKNVFKELFMHKVKSLRVFGFSLNGSMENTRDLRLLNEI